MCCYRMIRIAAPGDSGVHNGTAVAVGGKISSNGFTGETGDRNFANEGDVYIPSN